MNLCVMVHKLGKVTGESGNKYTLKSMIEMDECYFTIEASEQADKL